MAKAKAAPGVSKLTGRPSGYSQTKVDLICNLVSCGMSIRKICKENESLPDPVTVYKWLSENEAFSKQYARAREDGAALMAEELLEIVDDESNDLIEITTEKGTYTQVNHAKVQRDRLRADTRKWLLAKLQPKKYGEPKEAATAPTAVEIKGGLPE